jgi:hypothetical protein
VGALSVEFYYFSRELIRAQHKRAGLSPAPPTSLLPPGFSLGLL